MKRQDQHAKRPPLETEVAALRLLMSKLRDPMHPKPVPPKHDLPK